MVFFNPTGKEQSFFVSTLTCCRRDIEVDVLLSASILWSLLTCISLHVKVAKTDKTHLPLSSRVVLVFISLFSSCARLLALVCFFTPFMGLFSLLNHHKLEQTPSPDRGGELPLLESRSGNKTWREIDRWTYDHKTGIGSAPGYNRYTLFTVAESLQLFGILIFLQFLAVYMVKVTNVDKFRDAGSLKKLIHATENMTIAYPFEDFDVLNGSAIEHRERFEKVKIEIVMTMTVNFLVHLLMLAPLWYTGEGKSSTIRISWTLNNFLILNDFLLCA